MNEEVGDRPAEARRMGDELWTVDEIAAYFKVSPWTIRDWRNADHPTFPAALDLPGRSLRWYGRDIVEWALSLRGALT